MKYNIYEIFHFLGGHNFYYLELENPIIPSYVLKTNVIDFSRFEKYTGLKIEQINEFDQETSLNNTINMIGKDKWQLVFVNCFYLPYDQQNFKKNIDNHIVIIKKYDYESNEFLVFDPKCGDNRISQEDLLLARFNTLQNHALYLEIKAADSRNDLIEILSKDDFLSIVKANNDDFTENGICNLKNFKEKIIIINELDSIYRKIALNMLSRALRHPHGPITTRKLMELSVQRKGSKINEIYSELSAEWFSLANNLIRLQHNNIDMKIIVDLYDSIIKKETEAAMLISKTEGDYFEQANI